MSTDEFGPAPMDGAPPSKSSSLTSTRELLARSAEPALLPRFDATDCSRPSLGAACFVVMATALLLLLLMTVAPWRGDVWVDGMSAS
jgi:hypothetical protein